MALKQKLLKHKIIIVVLLFCIIARFYIFPFPFDDKLPLGTNQGNYLHYIDALKDKSVGDWDYSWLGGYPLLTFYPPFSMQLAYLFVGLLGAISAFKLVFAILFALTPLAFYYLLKEFKLKQKETIVALLIFSFTFYFNAIIAVGMQFALISATLFGIIFLKFFIRAVKQPNFLNIFMASAFLAITIMSHSLATFVFGLLSVFYLVSSLYVKWDISKIKRAFLSYVGGFLISAIWFLPFILEMSQNSIFEYARSPLTAIPFVGMSILYGYYVNFASILITALASILLLWCLKKEFEIPLKKDVDSTFLKITIISTFAIYIIFYVLFPQYFPVKADRFINIWIIPFAILFARSIDKKILKYLVIAFVASQILLFIGTSIQTSNDYTRYYGALNFLSGQEGRATFQPQDSGIDLITLYLAPKFNVSLTIGDAGLTISPTRSKLVGMDVTFFDCSERRSFTEQIFSLDIFSRKSLVYLDGCRLVKDNYKKILDLQHTTHVVADRKFPATVETFENDADFKQVAEFDGMVVFEYLEQKPYVETDRPEVTASYKKERNQISVYLHSDVQSNVSVRLSEGWYPSWKSDVALSQDENGYIIFNTQVDGDKTIVLDYVKPYYYGVGKALSLIALILMAIMALRDSFCFKRFI